MVGRIYRRDANLVCHRLIVFRFSLQISPGRPHHSGGYCRKTFFRTNHACWNGCWHLGLHRRSFGNYQAKGESPPGLCIDRDWRASNAVSCLRTGVPPLRMSLARRLPNSFFAAQPPLHPTASYFYWQLAFFPIVGIRAIINTINTWQQVSSNVGQLVEFTNVSF